MAVTKEQLKKHHFWILSGLIPLLVLIAVILITSGVGSAIDKKRDEIDKAKKDLTAKKDPKSNPLLEKMGLQQKVLDTKRGDLWKENWERQIGVADGKQDPEKNLLRWPESPKLAAFNYTENYLKDPNQLPFGAEIKLAGQERRNQRGEYDEFKKREVYLAEFSDARPGEGYAGKGMADTVAPTRFASGWEKTLRYVDIPKAGDKTGWGIASPQPEQLWLALEDIWVQRAMLAAVRQVNADVARFVKIPRRDDNGKDLPDDPLKRRFRSRLWEVELEVNRREDGRWVMTGKLRNLSDRMALLGGQASGAPSPMVLNVWTSAEAGAAPFAFQIGGSFVPGGGTMTVLTTDKHLLPTGNTPIELARVEQEFDAATVPVRRIDRLVLGYPDSRYAAVPLKTPEFAAFKAEEQAAQAATESAGSGMLSGGPSMDMGGPMAGGRTGAAAATARQLEGGGPVKGVIDGNRKRYVEITEQVRRMPVAITLVTDQAYIQDVLLAYANSPFRFQTTQVHWRRFRGALGGSDGGAGSAGTGLAGRGGPAGGPGMGLAGGGDTDTIGGPATGIEGGGFSIGRGPRGGGLGQVGGPGGLGGPDRSAAAGGGAAVGAEQLNAGLIELTIYGVVSIYEKYQPTADGAVAAK